MQTFLPYADFEASARALDYRRLGKQRVEVKQIYKALTGQSKGWTNHPATRMWRGYEPILLRYGATMCREWRQRGYKDSLLEEFLGAGESLSCSEPPWLGDEALHLSHRANLVAKMPEYYVPLFGQLDFIPYVWPDPTSE